MGKTDILARTEKGDQEIATQANKLPIKHRSVLIMIDGKNSEESLQAKLSSLFNGPAILGDLESHGYIIRKAGPAIAPAAVMGPTTAAAGKGGSLLESIVSRVKDMSAEYEAK